MTILLERNFNLVNRIEGLDEIIEYRRNVA